MDKSVSIVIPSIKPDCKEQIKEILGCKYGIPVEVFSVNKQQSAATNRNACIDKAKHDKIIMCDDDITGYFDLWADYMQAHFYIADYSILSVRPIRADGSLCPHLGDNNGQLDDKEPIVRALHTDRTGLNLCGSATIMFNRKDGIRFDEGYKGGGCYEDTDFCMQYKKKWPDRDIMICNDVKLIHNMERKGRETMPGTYDNHNHNRGYFAEKWGIEL